MATIQLHDDGLFSLVIPATDGKDRTYRLAVVPPGLAEWAATLTRCDTEDTHRVTRGYDGRWACTCTAFFYRKRGVRDCRHTAAMRSVRAMLTALNRQPERASV